MIIHPPQLGTKNGGSILSTRIEIKTSNFPFPKTLWFSFPLEYEQFIHLRGDAFLVGTIFPAMILGEDIEINAPVSPKLVNGLMEYQKILAIWFPKLLKPIQIYYNNLEVLSPGNCRGETASLFSGGVDSSFILNANLPPQHSIEVMQIKHAIFVLGADFPISQRRHFDDLANLFIRSLDPIGVNLITGATNVRSFTEGLLKWEYCHGAALLATGIILSGLLERLYIASSYNYRNLMPWGSSPLLDQWLSTESLDIVHTGASYRRTKKMKVVANWEPAQGYLRVCPTTEPDGKVNCERCDKCLGTKALLEMEGTLGKFDTFIHPFRYRDYFRWAWVCNPQSVVPRFILRKAIIERRWNLIPFVLILNISRFIRYWLDRWLPSWLRKILRDRYYPLEKNPFYAGNLVDQ
jgi:hypothetical protein